MKMKNTRKVSIFILIFLTAYVCLSAFAGFPLGFGKIMERNAVKRYCGAVYPQARLGKTVFNPVGGGYVTTVSLENETIRMGVDLGEGSIVDPHRADLFLKENGVSEILSGLERSHDCYLYCRVVWKCDDPTAFLASLGIDYTDYESSPLPGEDQIKELLAPIVLDCMTQVEEILPLESVVIQYYHPDFDPCEERRIDVDHFQFFRQLPMAGLPSSARGAAKSSLEESEKAWYTVPSTGLSSEMR